MFLDFKGPLLAVLTAPKVYNQAPVLCGPAEALLNIG